MEREVQTIYGVIDVRVFFTVAVKQSYGMRIFPLTNMTERAMELYTYAIVQTAERK